MSELAKALAAVQAKLPRITKGDTAIVQTKTGSTYGYHYANLADISEAVLPLLAEHGLAFCCCPTLRAESTTFVLAYSLLHESGEKIEGQYPLPVGMPQALGSAITYARRYVLCAVTGAAPDEDDDDGERFPANKDGSLSRSRTTDAEKDAAGVMTAAQQAEHTALQPKQAEVRGKVTRLQAGEVPPYDPWVVTGGGKPEDGRPLGEPEERPGTVSAQQQRAIHAACTGMDRAKRLATISDIVGRQVASSNELSYVEAAAVLGKLSGVTA